MYTIKKIILSLEEFIMARKILSLVVVGLMLLAPAAVYAKGFSGGHSTGSSSSYSRSYHGSSTATNGATSGSTYHSGYRAPSPNVRNGSSSYSNPNIATNRSRGGFLSHAAAFGAGTLFGSMLHPFGGGYGGPGFGMGGGFSIFGILLDILIIWIVYKVVRGLFARRRY
jgi:hypothetical protein